MICFFFTCTACNVYVFFLLVIEAWNILWKGKPERCILGSKHMCDGKVVLPRVFLEMESLTNASIELLASPWSHCLRKRYNYSFTGFFSELNPRDDNIPVELCSPSLSLSVGSVQCLSFWAQGTPGLVKWGTAHIAELSDEALICHTSRAHTLISPRHMKSCQRWNQLSL